MTPEATDRTSCAHRAAGRLQKVCRFDVGRAHSQVEPIERTVITDPALIQSAVFFEYVRLAGMAKAKGPTKRDNQHLLAIGYSVNTLIPFALDAVGVRAALKGQHGMSF